MYAADHNYVKFYCAQSTLVRWYALKTKKKKEKKERAIAEE